MFQIFSVVLQQTEEIKWLKQQQQFSGDPSSHSQPSSLPNYRRFTPDEVRNLCSQSQHD